MAYPAGITLRTVNVGGATALESGEPLTITVRFAASRPLIWGATGWRFPSVVHEVAGTVGNEISVDLPVTDQSGWRTNSNQVIDVSAAGSYTHTYTATVTTTANGRVVSQDVIGPFVLPTGDGSPVDLDLTLPVGTQAGGVVQVPDTWDAKVAAAEAAAARSQPRVDVDVRDYGDFAEASSWQVNRDALQAANDAVAALGGGIVRLPRGTFQIKGVVQRSHVTYQGHGTTLAHPDGLTGHMIEAALSSTSGSIAADSFDLTVASAAGIEVGTVVAVAAGRGASDRQSTLLASAIDATQTTGITLSNPDAFPASGYMTIGSEVVQYTGITAGELTGVTRGSLGTTAAAHGTAGPADVVAVAAHHIAQVVRVSGTAVTLDRAAAFSVTGAPITFGIVSPGIYDVHFEGNRQTGASVHYPVSWTTVGNGHGDNITAHNAQSTVFLGLGAIGCRFGSVAADDCLLTAGVGAAFWMFQSCRGNTLNSLRVTGRIFIGVYIDDRTTIASPFDGPGEDNHVGDLAIDIPVTIPMHQLTEHTIGILVSAGRRNTVGAIHARGVRTGIVFEHGGQSKTWDASKPACSANAVGVFRGRDLYQPWVIDAPGNAVMSANFESYLAYGVMDGKPYIGHMVGPNGEEALKFPGGTVQAPGIAFRDETSMGIFRQSAGMMQTIVAGKAITRITSEGLRIENNGDLLFATDNSRDIGRITSLRPRDVRAARYVAVGSVPTASLTTPDVAGVGALVYDSTRGKVIVSNGTAWVNLDGTAL